jgi:hypothetical protein
VTLYCALCYFVRSDAEEAVTVINGQAVCDDHLGYVQGGVFTQALILVKRNEPGDES